MLRWNRPPVFVVVLLFCVLLVGDCWPCEGCAISRAKWARTHLPWGWGVLPHAWLWALCAATAIGTGKYWMWLGGGALASVAAWVLAPFAGPFLPLLLAVVALALSLRSAWNLKHGASLWPDRLLRINAGIGALFAVAFLLTGVFGWPSAYSMTLAERLLDHGYGAGATDTFERELERSPEAAAALCREILEKGRVERGIEPPPVEGRGSETTETVLIAASQTLYMRRAAKKLLDVEGPEAAMPLILDAMQRIESGGYDGHGFNLLLSKYFEEDYENRERYGVIGGYDGKHADWRKAWDNRKRPLAAPAPAPE